jgi:hypothetical protein
VSFYPPVTDSFIILAPFWSSLAIFHHARISVQNLWIVSEPWVVVCICTKNYLSERRLRNTWGCIYMGWSM